MTPLNTYKTLVFTITTMILFFVWSFSLQLFNDSILFGILIDGFISVGTYRLTSKLIEFLCSKSLLLKKTIFGPSYLEGTWIGFYLDCLNNPVYFIEKMEQSFDTCIIRGTAYFSDFTCKGFWVSDNVNIDVKTGTMVYTYTTSFFNNNHKNEGIGVFNFDRKSMSKPPSTLRGFTSDIYFSGKVKSIEVKIDPKELDEKEILLEAEKFYHLNKKYY